MQTFGWYSDQLTYSNDNLIVTIVRVPLVLSFPLLPWGPFLNALLSNCLVKTQIPCFPRTVLQRKWVVL